MDWSLIKRFLLRFSFIYWVLYIFPYGFEYLDWLDTNHLSFWTKLTPWFGEEFLGWTFNPERLGKGFDSKYDFARFILCAILSIILSLLWLFVDSKKGWHYHDKLNTLMRTMLRYHVGFTLVLYGIAKVYQYQFGYMGLDRMDGPVGNQSPMGFLWLFMSYSPTYNIATGLIEMVAGFLLLFRRSVLLGAIISFIAMANVVLIDIAYDVTVKMFAIHLWLMVIVLLIADFKRLLNVVILNKATQPIIQAPLFNNLKSKRVAYVVKTMLIGYVLFSIMSFSGDIRKNMKNTRAQSVLHNKYIVDTFMLNQDTIPALVGNQLRWKELNIGSSYSANILNIKDMNDQSSRYTYEADTVGKTLHFQAQRDSSDTYQFQYLQPSDKEFQLIGIHKEDSIKVTLRIFSREDYRLGRGKINWVRDL